MYYPLLRSKQYELIALREIAELGVSNIFPIIEPVNSSFKTLNTAIKKLVEKNINTAVILNPKVGELTKIDNCMNMVNENVGFELNKSIYPTFHVNNNNLKQVLNFIKNNKLDKIILILDINVIRDNDSFEYLINIDKINRFIIKGNNINLISKLPNKPKIIFRDKFNRLARNADYVNVEDEFFSDDFLIYKNSGFDGFGDYLTIGKDFNTTGALPFAIAIHLTYYDNVQKQKRIRHFVSDTNDDRSNPQGKFGEAVKKAVQFIEEKQLDNTACKELKDNYEKRHYPGLGSIKKISIKNHLELVSSLLD